MYMAKKISTAFYGIFRTWSRRTSSYGCQALPFWTACCIQAFTWLLPTPFRKSSVELLFMCLVKLTPWH